MSQSTAVPATRPARAPRPPARPAGRAQTSRLRVVSAPAYARSRAGLVVASLALLAIGLVGLLMINLSLEQGAFASRSQQAEIEQLMERRQGLQTELAALKAPQALARHATALGMVPAPNVAFVRPDGQVLGVPSPAVARPSASVTPESAGGASPAAAAASPTATPASTKVTGSRPATTTSAPGARATTGTTPSPSSAGHRTGRTGAQADRTAARPTTTP